MSHLDRVLVRPLYLQILTFHRRLIGEKVFFLKKTETFINFLRIAVEQNSNIMSTIKKTLAIAIFFMTSIALQAQTSEATEVEKSLDAGTIESRFEYILEESNRYKEYKVVKTTWLEALKAHVADSLSGVYQTLNEERDVIVTQKNEIEKLKEDIKAKDGSIVALNNEKDSMVFLGMGVGKGAYQGIMWTLVALLLGGMLFFMYLFKQSNAITDQTSHAFNELQMEFNEFRKSSRLREQKIARQLQDELNSKCA